MLMCCKDNEKINLMDMFAEKKLVCLLFKLTRKKKK